MHHHKSLNLRSHGSSSHPFPRHELIDCGNWSWKKIWENITIRPGTTGCLGSCVESEEWQKKRMSVLSELQLLRNMGNSRHARTAGRLNTAWKSNKIVLVPVLVTSLPRPPVLVPRLVGPVLVLVPCSPAYPCYSFKTRRHFPGRLCNWTSSPIGIAFSGSWSNRKYPALHVHVGTAASPQAARRRHSPRLSQASCYPGRENMELSNLDSISLGRRDALTFVKQEVKRGKNTVEFILDPPYGHGTDGGVGNWKIHQWKWWKTRFVAARWTGTFPHSQHLFTQFLLSSSRTTLLGVNNLNFGELYLQATSGRKLPLGFWEVCKTLSWFFAQGLGTWRMSLRPPLRLYKIISILKLTFLTKFHKK